MGPRFAARRRVVVWLILPVLAATSMQAPMQSAAAEPADRAPAQVSDFDGDGFADVVVGGEGAIFVIYGAASGLQAKRHQRWNIEDLPSGSRTATGGSGATGTAGDFDVDGFSDLAMQDEGDHVLYGSAAGLTLECSTYFPIAVNSGASMSSGNFGRSRHADLAIGAPVDDSGSRAESGAVSVLYGSPTGLTMSGHQEWSQDSRGIRGTAEEGDGFGAVLVAADFGRTAYDDLAIGVPDEWPIGAVNVIYGSASGLTPEGNQLWTERSPGVLGKAGTDAFGGTFTAGNFGRDLGGRPFDDLAIGAPDNEPLNDFRGAVHVLYGTAAGLTVVGTSSGNRTCPGCPVPQRRRLLRQHDDRRRLRAKRNRNPLRRSGHRRTGRRPEW